MLKHDPYFQVVTFVPFVRIINHLDEFPLSTDSASARISPLLYIPCQLAIR